MTRQVAEEIVQKFITHARTSEGVRKRNQKSAGGWLISPGTWVPYVEGYRALVRIARPEHLVDGELKRIQVGGFKGGTRVYMWPTTENDVDGIEVKRYGSRYRMNMADFLARINQRPEVGVSRRFDLVEADQDSPFQPALMIYLDKPLETSYFETSTKKKKKAGSARSQSEAKKPEAGGASAQSDARKAEAAGDSEPEAAN